MGFKVSVTQEFAAAHWLDNYPGQCSRIHGHTWKVELEISGNHLDDIGMLVDFRDMKDILSSILKQFDHTLINELAPFDKVNPTAENLARYIYNEAKAMIKMHQIEQVKVWESPVAWASYGED